MLASLLGLQGKNGVHPPVHEVTDQSVVHPVLQLLAPAGRLRYCVVDMDHLAKRRRDPSALSIHPTFCPESAASQLLVQ